MKRGLDLGIEVAADWKSDLRNELQGNEDQVIETARQIYMEALSQVREEGIQVESNVPDKFRPDIDIWLLFNPSVFNTDPGTFLVAASIVKGYDALHLSLGGPGPSFDVEENFSWLREDIYRVVERLVEGKPNISVVAGEKTGASYYHGENAEVLSVKITPSIPSDYPSTLDPIINYLGWKSDEYDLRGAIPHEMTHAFIDRNSDIHHKDPLTQIMSNFTGEENYSGEHYAVDESAAQAVSYLITNTDVATLAYESSSGRMSGIDRERMHTLMQIYIRGVQGKSLGESIGVIRNLAVNTIGYVSEGHQAENVLNELIQNEFDTGYNNETLQTMAGTASMVRAIQYELIDYMVYIGVLDEEKAIHAKKDLIESSTEMLSNKRFIPRENEEGFQLDDLRRGIRRLDSYDLTENHQQIVESFKSDFSKLISEFKEEKALLNNFESSELDKEKEADEHFLLVKDRFSNPEVTSPKNTQAFKKNKEEIKEEYMAIISDYKNMIHALNKLNSQIIDTLGRLHDDEENVRKIVEQYSMRDDQVISRMMQETEKDYERVNKGQQMTEDMQERIENVEGKISDL